MNVRDKYKIAGKQLHRAREWIERYTSAQNQGHNESLMERFDNYVQYGVDATVENQRDLNRQMFLAGMEEEE